MVMLVIIVIMVVTMVSIVVVVMTIIVISMHDVQTSGKCMLFHLTLMMMMLNGKDQSDHSHPKSTWRSENPAWLLMMMMTIKVTVMMMMTIKVTVMMMIIMVKSTWRSENPAWLDLFPSLPLLLTTFKRACFCCCHCYCCYNIVLVIVSVGCCCCYQHRRAVLLEEVLTEFSIGRPYVT